MTRAEYMEKLWEKLENFGRELQEDIMEDYRQHFAEGERQGKTEEEIIRELGNIEDMVRDLPESDLKENMMNQFPDMTEEPQKEPESRGEAEEKKEPADIVCENNCGKSRESVNEKSLVYSGNYKAIELNGEDADIYLEASEDDRIHVEYANRSKNPARLYEYYQYEENGTFYAGVKSQKNTGNSETAKRKESSWKMTLFGQTIISYTKMGNIENDLNLTLTVKIPANKIPGLHAKASSGDIHLTRLTQEELSVESLSGDIKASGITSGILQFQANSGDMILSDITCGKKLTVRTFSGDLNMKNINCRQWADIKVSSGDAEITNLTGHDLRVGSLSGDLHLVSLNSDTLNVDAVSGDISLNDAAFKSGTVSSRSGDLSFSGLRFETGNFSSNRGDITFSNAEFETGNFTTENGDISGTNTKASQGNFTAKKGDIALKDNSGSHCGKYRCTTESGDICVQADTETYECVTRGGDISVTAFGTPKRLSLRSSGGDLETEVFGTPEIIELQSDNGDICLSISGSQGMEVNMDSNRDDSEIRWNGERNTIKKGICVYGNGGTKVMVSSGSGDIVISGSSL